MLKIQTYMHVMSLSNRFTHAHMFTHHLQAWANSNRIKDIYQPPNLFDQK